MRLMDWLSDIRKCVIFGLVMVILCFVVSWLMNSGMMLLCEWSMLL